MKTDGANIKQQAKQCRILWAAVLESAIIDIKKNKKKRDTGTQALIWLYSKESRPICSFIGICRTLDLNPIKTRQSILRYVYGGNKN